MKQLGLSRHSLKPKHKKQAINPYEMFYMNKKHEVDCYIDTPYHRDFYNLNF